MQSSLAFQGHFPFQSMKEKNFFHVHTPNPNFLLTRHFFSCNYSGVDFYQADLAFSFFHSDQS